MTDLEMTRLCAEAMGYVSCIGGVQPRGEQRELYWRTPRGEMAKYAYDPLHDDAQAMALVKKFDLSVWGHSYAAGDWKFHAEYAPFSDGKDSILGHGITHNRAIVECVAKMQAAKK